MSVLDDRGQVLDAEPIVPDFGDILPYLDHYGYGDFALEQIRLAQGHIKAGLFHRGGRVRLFENHDWLLGVVEMYERTGEHWLLKLAHSGSQSLVDLFVRHMLLIDERPRFGDWRSWLMRSNPFNGGYIELLVDLHRATGDHRYLDWSSFLADGWIKTPYFQSNGLFASTVCVGPRVASPVLSRFALRRVRLFKDNTNMMWGLLAVAQATGERRFTDAIETWLAGFERHFWNRGRVWLWIDRLGNGREPSLKAAFSSMDLLCDLHHAGIGDGRALVLASAIGDYWLGIQWSNGLFPEFPGGSTDHLDANVDMVGALTKLATLSGQTIYREAAVACALQVLEAHDSPAGYTLAVNDDGTVADGRIIVKYQALITKLDLLMGQTGPALWEQAESRLLRDR